MLLVAAFWWGLFSWLYYDSFVMVWWAEITFRVKAFGCFTLDQEYFCSVVTATEHIMHKTAVGEETFLVFSFLTALPFVITTYRKN